MSLRTRLLVALVVVVGSLAIAGWAIAANQHRFLVDQVDQQLEAAAVPAVGLASDGALPRPGGPGATGGPAPSALSELYVGLVVDDGTVTDLLVPGAADDPDPAVPVFGAGQLVRVRPAPPFGISDPFTTSASSGADFRVVVVDRPGGGSRVVVGLSLARADASERRLLLTGLLAAGAIAAVLGLVVWWVVRLGLRPFRVVTEAADAITRGEHGRRVEALPASTEAGRLQRAFNLMLDEREQADDRLRRFVADASHELRTPLTSIRGYVDLLRAGALVEAADRQDALRRVAQESHRMAGLVDDLLLLARLDQGRPLERRAVDLSAIVTDAAVDVGAVQPTRPVRRSVAPGLVVRGDEARLRQVLAALVHNALVHTPAETALHLSATTGSGHVVIEVSDDGPGMPAELVERAFERFVRGDPARSRAAGGSGLGLGIVRAIVEALDGVVELESSEETGTTVRVVLPQDTPESQET